MICLRSSAEIEKIRSSCKITARVLRQLKEYVRPAVTTAFLDAKAKELIEKEGAEPAFKGYKGYPACICTSINEEILHGIPGKRQLKSGDIISLDVGVKYNGYFGDAATTIAVGVVKADTQRLLRVAKDALAAAIAQAVDGNRVGDISSALQEHIEKNGFSAVRDFVGHGIGANIHEEPGIPNYGLKGTGPRLKTGMVLAIEAMVNMGGYPVRILDDGWTVVSADGMLSAHFEDTVAIIDGVAEILTV